MATIIPFNPLDKQNLGASVAEALLGRPAEPLRGLGAFNGAGIYAIYYHGPFAPYAPLAARNNQPGGPTLPIYVGKAIPAGGRKGASLDGVQTTRALSNRLKQHADSIAATNLNLDDFTCRYLVVDDIWIPLGEALLIAKFSPAWNVYLDGFGNHDPGSGRHNGMRPRWDVLHPGRAWAERLAARPENAQEIGSDVGQYLRMIPLPTSVHVRPSA